MTNIVTGEYHEIEEQIAAPANPPAGRLRLYAINGAFECIDDLGADYPLVSGINKIGDVNAAAPADGQALIWDNTAGEWVPGASGDPNFVGEDPAPVGVVASGADTIAAAPGAKAYGNYSVALGRNANSNGIEQVAIGNNSAAGTGASAIAIGDAAENMVGTSIAIGQNAYNGGNNSLAIGVGAFTYTNDNAVAVGFQAYAYNTFGIAVGSDAKNFANNGTVVGANAINRSANGVVIGYLARNKTGTSGAVAIGYNAVTYADNCIAIGSNASAQYGANNIAMGYYTGIGSTYRAVTRSVALGTRAYGHMDSMRAFSGAVFTHSVYGFPISGSVQDSVAVLSAKTADATPTLLAAGGAGTDDVYIDQGIPLASDGISQFKLFVCGMDTAGNAFAEEIHGAVKFSAGSTSLVGAVTSVRRVEDAGATGYTVAVAAGGATGTLQITVTGAAATDIYWVGKLELTDLKFG